MTNQIPQEDADNLKIFSLEAIADHIRGRMLANRIAEDEPIAIALSGGPDSVALAYALNKVTKIVALTVDHGLRDGSAAEAERVSQSMQDAGIEHHVLRWEGEKPVSNIQAQARAARYKLLEDWCKASGIKVLATGHQRDDVAETFLLRLMRGSGVDGLSAMPAVSPGLVQNENVARFRPLLDIRKADLLQVLERENIPFVDDPSNDNRQFDRVKVRQFLKSPTLEGLTVDKLADTAARLALSRQALEVQTRDWFYRVVSLTPHGSVRLALESLDKAPRDIGYRIVAASLQLIAGSIYKPRMDSLIRLFEALFKDDFKGQTLGGVVFEKGFDDGVFMSREARAMPVLDTLENGALYDNRWRIHVENVQEAKGVSIGPLTEEGWKKLKLRDRMEQLNELRFKERISLPAFYRDGALLGVFISGLQSSRTIFESGGRGAGMEDAPGAYLTPLPAFFDLQRLEFD